MARSTSSPAAASDTPISGVSGGSFALNLLVALRPSQWTKNLLVFAGLLFGMQLFVPWAVARALAAFVIFCALSGVVYLINDIFDRDSDRRHPIKARRPIASGALSVQTATCQRLPSRRSRSPPRWRWAGRSRSSPERISGCKRSIRARSSTWSSSTC